MDWTVCSRELERDYTWDNSHASHPVAESAQRIFAPAFEGSLTTSRFAALLRCPGSPLGMMLGVSVYTVRKDFRNRPIRTMAFLRAETPEEANLLAAFFAECLRKPDEETLYDADSPLAKAVESLYQTKKLDEFIAFCKTLPAIRRWTPPVPRNERNEVSSSMFFTQGIICPLEPKSKEPEPPDFEVPLTGRSMRPRSEMAARERTAGKLGAIIGSGTPFLVTLTDRVAEDVMKSLGPDWARTPVRIFSKQAASLRTIPAGAGLEPGVWSEPASQKYVRAAAIGGAVILSLLVAAVLYFRDDGPTNPGEGESKVTEVASINAAKCGGGNGENVATNRSGAGETVSVPTINDSSREQAEAVRVDTVAATNVQQQTTAITNAPSANPITTEDERGGNTSTNRPGAGGQVPVAATNDLTQAEAESVTIDQVAATNAMLQMTAITNAPPAKPIPPSENE